ncbi:MAG: sensor histidine kinase [Terriglobales bacterium]
MKPHGPSNTRFHSSAFRKSCLAVTPIDLNRHKRNEQAAREQAVFDERTRIAAEMHDTVVKGLNAIVIQARAAEEEFMEKPEQSRQRLRDVCEIACESLAEARRSIWTLSCESSDNSDNEDPAIALGSLAQKLFDGTPMELQLHLEEDACGLTREARIGLLRIGQEALVNVRRHARASTVCVELHYRKRDVRLSVSDDGQGFLPSLPTSARRGFGLFGFQARAEQLGGKVMVHSQLKRGTQVVATIPTSPLRLRQAA